MNKALSQRITELMNAKNIGVTRLAKIIGVSHQAITNWRNGNTAVSTHNLKKLADAFDDVDFQWLATGEGTMIKTPVQREYCLDCIRKDAQIELLKSQVSQLEGKIELLNKKIWRCEDE